MKLFWKIQTNQYNDFLIVSIFKWIQNATKKFSCYLIFYVFLITNIEVKLRKYTITLQIFENYSKYKNAFKSNGFSLYECGEVELIRVIRICLSMRCNIIRSHVEMKVFTENVYIF